METRMNNSVVSEDLTEKEEEGREQEWLSDEDEEPKKKRARKN